MLSCSKSPNPSRPICRISLPGQFGHMHFDRHSQISRLVNPGRLTTKKRKKIKKKKPRSDFNYSNTLRFMPPQPLSSISSRFQVKRKNLFSASPIRQSLFRTKQRHIGLPFPRLPLRRRAAQHRISEHRRALPAAVEVLCLRSPLVQRPLPVRDVASTPSPFHCLVGVG